MFWESKFFYCFCSNSWIISKSFFFNFKNQKVLNFKLLNYLSYFLTYILLKIVKRTAINIRYFFASKFCGNYEEFWVVNKEKKLQKKCNLLGLTLSWKVSEILKAKDKNKTSFINKKLNSIQLCIKICLIFY